MARCIDWPSIEVDYRSNKATDRELAARLGVSHAAVQKHAKRHGWERNLGERIKARTKSAVANEIAKVAKASRKQVGALLEDEIVEINADVAKNIILEDRARSAGALELVASLYAELRAVSNDQTRIALETFALEGHKQRSPAARKALERALDAALSLPGRIQSVAKLTPAYISLTELNRKINYIDDEAKTEEDPWKQMIDWITRNNKPHVSVQVNNVSPVVSASPFVREVK